VSNIGCARIVGEKILESKVVSRSREVKILWG